MEIGLFYFISIYFMIIIILLFTVSCRVVLCVLLVFIHRIMPRPCRGGARPNGWVAGTPMTTNIATRHALRTISA